MRRLQQDVPRRSVRERCALLGVRRSWVSARAQGPTQAERAGALRAAIARSVLDFPGYGYRRVTAARQRQAWTVNHPRVLRIMRQEALRCQLQRRWVATTDARHGRRTDPNRLAGLIISRPNQAWVADRTSVRLPTCCSSLACVLDAWSRRSVGWQRARTIATQRTLAALDHALARRQPAPGLIHHADRGV